MHVLVWTTLCTEPLYVQLDNLVYCTFICTMMYATFIYKLFECVSYLATKATKATLCKLDLDILFCSSSS